MYVKVIKHKIDTRLSDGRAKLTLLPTSKVHKRMGLLLEVARFYQSPLSEEVFVIPDWKKKSCGLWKSGSFMDM